MANSLFFANNFTFYNQFLLSPVKIKCSLPGEVYARVFYDQNEPKCL